MINKLSNCFCKIYGNVQGVGYRVWAKKIAENYNIPLPAAALQFPLFNEIIASVIPGARSKNEFKQILQWFTLKIPIDFWKELRAKELIHHEAPISNN